MLFSSPFAPNDVFKLWGCPGFLRYFRGGVPYVADYLGEAAHLGQGIGLRQVAISLSHLPEVLVKLFHPYCPWSAHGDCFEQSFEFHLNPS